MFVRALPLYGAPYRARVKVKTVKVSSGALGGDFAKVCTCESFPLYGIPTRRCTNDLHDCIHSQLIGRNVTTMAHGTRGFIVRSCLCR